MGKTTGIGWTDHTWNPWYGCHKVSSECARCYIDGVLKRMGKQPFNGPMRSKTWNDPFAWNRDAIKTGERRKVFTCSLSDFFHQMADEWRPNAWEVIRECDGLDWLILTKRPELIAETLPKDWGNGYPNVWLGVTVGCKATVGRLEMLESIPARIKWVSSEPLLEAMDFSPYLSWLDWIVTGCEQAAKEKRRRMDVGWVRAIDEQCKAFGKAHFFKQAYFNDQGTPVHEPLLDGKVIQEWPESVAA